MLLEEPELERTVLPEVEPPLRTGFCVEAEGVEYERVEVPEERVLLPVE